MNALFYNGARDVSVKNVPDAKIEQPNDVLVKITSTNICGSDLHMYEGRTGMKSGMVLGHENLGEVVEVGTCDQPHQSWRHRLSAVQHRLWLLQGQ